MTSPDRDADLSPSTYHVYINEGTGIVIGNNAQVTQHFHEIHSEPHVDLVAAEAAYRQKIVEAYSPLSFSGFDRSDISLVHVPLADIFIRLTLTVEKVIRESLSPESSNHTRLDEKSARERVIRVQEPITLAQALSQPLLIIGEPGAGKSTLLRWLAVTFGQKRQQEPNCVGTSADADLLPFFVTLGRLPDRFLKLEGGETPNWFQVLPEYLSSQMAFTGTPPQLLKRALAEGRCLLLLDGLDEIADRQVRARIARSLDDLAHLSPINKVVISSRSAGIRESESVLRPQFQRCQIERFTPQDVERFFHFWYALDPDLTLTQQYESADALFAKVQSTPAILQLATTPLLSTILLLIWRNEGNLPERRVELYERCCHILIEPWETSHDVVGLRILGEMHWEDHIRLLAPLAFAIHSQEQRTNATREELVPVLAIALQTEGWIDGQVAATREARHFLETLGLRSGLLQYIGDDRYGFPHLTFQEYLVARYIAAQPDPDYIDLVMIHLHEAWWQEVHLLTIAHLGSRERGVSKASALILTLLQLYTPPSWILRSSQNHWIRLIKLGKHFPHMQFERNMAWMITRELLLAMRGYAECIPDRITAKVRLTISAQAISFMRRISCDPNLPTSEFLLPTIWQTQLQNNETIVNALLEALHDKDVHVRLLAIEILGQEGVESEVVVNALLEALHDKDVNISNAAYKGLRKIKLSKKPIEEVKSFLLQDLYDEDEDLRDEMKSLAQDLYDTDGDVQEDEVTNLQYLIKYKEIGEAIRAKELQDLHDADINVRLRAVASLGSRGVENEAAMNTLLHFLYDANKHLRRETIVSIGKMGVGNEAVESALLVALKDEDIGVRRRAVTSLGQLELSNEVVLNVLCEALHDEDIYLRERAATSLGKVGVGKETVVNALLQDLHDIDEDVRQRAATSLGKVGVGNETVVSSLLDVLYDIDIDVRQRAATSLGKVGVGNETVINALLDVFYNSSKVSVSNKIALNALLHVLFDPSNDLRAVVVKSLAKVGSESEAVEKTMLKALYDRDPGVRESAIEGLGHVEIKNSIQLRQILTALNHCLYDFDDRVRQSALYTICQLLDGRPIPGYQWISLRKRRARYHQLKSAAFWLAVAALIGITCLVMSWMLGMLDTNSLPARFLGVMIGIIAFVAVVAQVLTLRDPWNHS